MHVFGLLEQGGVPKRLPMQHARIKQKGPPGPAVSEATLCNYNCDLIFKIQN